MYLTALVAASLVAVALGGAVFLSTAVWPVPVAIVALGVVSVTVGAWFDELVAPFDLPVGGAQARVLAATRWVPALVVAGAIAVGGLRTSGRVIGSVLAVTLVWVETAAATAITSAMSTRALLPYPGELFDYAEDVFRAAAGPAGAGLSLAVVASVLGAVGAGVAAAARFRGARRSSDPSRV